MWHMHQPDYRNREGVMQMPWVFLHAIKDYYDMPWIAAKYEKIQVTFNITSPLLEQLKLYTTRPQQSDLFLSLWLKDPAQLKEQEKNWLVKLCKSAQLETMAESLPHYKVLYHQEHFTSAELTDLEVLFILAWCGNYLRTQNTAVQSLIKKEKNYSEDDKAHLLDVLAQFIAGIWDFYKHLHDEKRITISTTPFYHPILPLLMDMKNAQKANPQTVIPEMYETLEKDASLQVQKAQALFSDTFGYETDVFWPAEGAVDISSVNLMSSLGIRCIATDEAILFKSLHSQSRSLLYSPYNYNGMVMGFRDHELSDMIGFEYRYKEAQDAVSDFVSRLKKIENINDNATVFVVLDGENAWEFYRNNGFDFLDLFYKTLDRTDWCRTVRMEEAEHFPTRELIDLAPGSWINGSFDTWVGEKEKTRAWELLFAAKKDYAHHRDTLGKEVKEKITEHFLAAECSDWFWWYGSDHYTDFSREFDTLFRDHLIAIYTLIGISPPHDLLIPLMQNQSSNKFWIKPQSQITPMIDGKRDSFFEWMGCGIVEESKMFSTMEKQMPLVRKIYYGQDSSRLYFAFEGDISGLCKNGTVGIMIDPIGFNRKVDCTRPRFSADGIEIKLACKEWLEFSIDKGAISEDRISLRFEIEAEGKPVQTLPSFGALTIDLNDDYSKNWFV